MRGKTCSVSGAWQKKKFPQFLRLFFLDDFISIEKKKKLTKGRKKCVRLFSSRHLVEIMEMEIRKSSLFVVSLTQF